MLMNIILTLVALVLAIGLMFAATIAKLVDELNKFDTFNAFDEADIDPNYNKGDE